MRVEASPEAIRFVQEHGGKLYVWAKRSRCCHGSITFLETSSEPGERPFRRVEAAGMAGRGDRADRAAVGDHERGLRPGPDGVEAGEHALLVLGERLALGEAEVRAAAPPRRPGLGLLALDVRPAAPLPAAAMRLGEALVDPRRHADRRTDDLGRLPRAGQLARPDRFGIVGDVPRRREPLLGATRGHSAFGRDP